MENTTANTSKRGIKYCNTLIILNSAILRGPVKISRFTINTVVLIPPININRSRNVYAALAVKIIIINYK